MGRSSGRTGARTCPRCAALLLTDATTCGICRFDLTAPFAEPPEPVVAEPVVAETVAHDETDVVVTAPISPAVVDPVVVEPVVVEEAVVAPVVGDELRATDSALVADESSTDHGGLDEPAAAPSSSEDPATSDDAAETAPAVAAEAPAEAPAAEAPAAETAADTFVDPEPVVLETAHVEPVAVEPADEDASPSSDSGPVSPLVEPLAAPLVGATTPAPTFTPAPAHVATWRPDPRAVPAPTGTANAVVVLAILRLVTLGTAVVLAWWAVRQVQRTLDAVFSFSANGSNSTDGIAQFGDLKSAVALAGASALIGLVSMALAVAVLACLMLWSSKSRAVADAVSPGEHRWNQTWAVIGWIVPVANIVIPFQVVTDIYKSADPSTSQTRGRFSGSVPPMVLAWWASWVLSWGLLIAQFATSGATTSSAGVVKGFSSLQWLWLLATAVSTVTMILVIRQVAAWQAQQVGEAVAQAVTNERAHDPRFGTAWNDTQPVGLTPVGASNPAVNAPATATVNATQAYEPPAASTALAPTQATPAPTTATPVDRSRINPRDPFSWPPPGSPV